MNVDFEKDYTCLECPIHTIKDAYYFFPNQSQEMKVDPENPTNFQRFIFWKPKMEDYTETELKFLKDFSKYYKEKLKEREEESKKEGQEGEKKALNDITLPVDLTIDEMFRVLQCGNYDNEKSLTFLQKYLDNRILNLPSTKYMELLNTGFLYMHGLTKNYEPILHLKVKYLKEFGEKYDTNDILSAISHFIDYLIKHFFIPGQVERWAMFADLDKFALPKLDLLKKILDILEGRYPCRLHTTYFVNPPKGLTLIANLVFKFINEDYKKKFVFVNNDDISPLFESINKSQVEEQYGGTAKNITEFNSLYFLPEGSVSDGEPNGKIVSENEYLELCEKYKVGLISPYEKDAHSHLRKINPIKTYMKDVFVALENEANASKKGTDREITLENQESIAQKCQCKCTIF